MTDRHTMRFLIVEDDKVLSADLRSALVTQGWEADQVDSREGAIEKVTQQQYDAIILDRMLVDGDGLSALAAIRAKGILIPALVLSALGDAWQRVEGLESGADDYMVKPFSKEELIARLKVLTRRSVFKQDVLVFGELEILVKSRIAYLRQAKIKLTPREFDLLLYLAQNSGVVVSQTMILAHVFQLSFDPGTSVVEVHIARLRRQLDAENNAKFIRTIRNHGYVFQVD